MKFPQHLAGAALSHEPKWKPTTFNLLGTWLILFLVSYYIPTTPSLVIHGPSVFEGESRFSITNVEANRLPDHYPRWQWVSPSQRMLRLTQSHIWILQRRKDISYESVCQQKVQQPVQSYYRCRLVSQPWFQWLQAEVQYFYSLTKEVVVEDKVATMQVRSSDSPSCPRVLIHLPSYGTQRVKSVSSLSGLRSTAVPTVVSWPTTSIMQSHSMH